VTERITALLSSNSLATSEQEACSGFSIEVTQLELQQHGYFFLPNSAE
jgi:hypothetical protein